MAFQESNKIVADSTLCQYLPWDSDFFNLDIARIKVNRLTPSEMCETIAWCQSNIIDCLYLLADANDLDTILLAEDNDFRFVDIRLTLERSDTTNGCSDPGSFPGRIRPYVESDLQAIRDLARGGFRITRFYNDLNFPRATCDRLYETWVEKSCVQGYADAVLVADLDSQPAGFITCKQISASEGNIGLVGVGRNHQGMGIGQALVGAGVGWFLERSIQRVSVVTQGRNIPAQRLYQRAGFITQSLQLWYHKWFNPESS